MRRCALGLVVAFALVAGACQGTLGGVGGARVSAMPTPLGGDRLAPPEFFASGRANNGCDEALAGPAARGPVVIAVAGGQVGDRFQPRCVIVTAGTRVVFQGDLAVHPLTGGAVVAGEAYRDPSSTVPYASAGTEATFVPLEPGVYPFFCQVHWVLGMSGAVIAR